MSRHPAKNTKSSSRQEKVAEEFVDYLAKTSTPKAINIHEIIAATRQDPTLQAVTKAIDKRALYWHWHLQGYGESKTWTNSKHNPWYHPQRDENSHADYLTTKSYRSCPWRPSVYCQNQETSKRKSINRINDMVEEKTTSCGACQIATPRTTREPLQKSPFPASPWREVSVDFKQLSSCEYLLVITDDYSRYPAIELVRSTSASTVIPQLDKTFSTFGIPEIARSDNGPPFNGR